MSKKFPINFKKSNNNLSIKKEEKNNVDELGLSTVESKEKEGYSPLNDDMKMHYSNINDLINNKKLDDVEKQEKEENNNDNNNTNTNIPANNTNVTLGWVKNEQGQWIYNDSNGSSHKGWLNDNGVWYYLDSTTGIMSTGWYKDTDGKWYYL